MTEYEQVVSAFSPTFSYLSPSTAIWLGVSDADTEGWYYFTADRGSLTMKEVGFNYTSRKVLGWVIWVGLSEWDDAN